MNIYQFKESSSRDCLTESELKTNLEANIRRRTVHSKKGLSTMSWMTERKRYHFECIQVSSKHEQHLQVRVWVESKNPQWSDSHFITNLWKTGIRSRAYRSRHLDMDQWQAFEVVFNEMSAGMTLLPCLLYCSRTRRTSSYLSCLEEEKLVLREKREYLVESADIEISITHLYLRNPAVHIFRTHSTRSLRN